MNSRLIMVLFLLSCSLLTFAEQATLSAAANTQNQVLSTAVVKSPPAQSNQQSKANEIEKPKMMMDHSMHGSMAGMVHDHQPIAIPETSLVPQIALTLHRDNMDGYNLHIKLNNFNIAPPEFQADVGKVIDGHAHLYINGEKIQRVYGRYLHLPNRLFKPGVNMIMVSLNAHNHDVWTFDNKQVLASVAINQSSEKLVLTQFSSSPIH
ncbi:MAG: hypothetical protein HWE11_03360 [Gammaproteobacteria bacterium]|nr:hypothetical protein [Gammaproteobacteria bacterium]